MSRNIKDIVSDSKDGLRLYLESELDRYKLIAVKKVTNIVSSGIKLIVAIVVSAIAAFFLLSSFAMFWGEKIDNYPLAFLYVGLIVLGILIVIIIFSRFIISAPIMRKALEGLYEDE